MILNFMRNGDIELSIEASEIIGIGRTYCSGGPYGTVILLKGGASYDFGHSMNQDRFNHIRQEWLVARTTPPDALEIDKYIEM